MVWFAKNTMVQTLPANGMGRLAPNQAASLLMYFESIREPFVFVVHSEWVDEVAFELHATLPHTGQFLETAETVLTHPIQGLRLLPIGGGPGAGRQ